VRQPLAPGSPIDAKRYRRWINKFGSYRAGVNSPIIQSWLDQFDAVDRDLAARILDAVEFYGQSQIHLAFRQSLNTLQGWDRSSSRRVGKWRFVAMSGSAGESGDSMLYQFRLANNLDGKVFNNLFISRSDLLREKLSTDDTVVLLDDFSGTGNQVCEWWNNPQLAFGELLAGVGKVYLVLIAASRIARNKITDETSICLMPAHELHEGHNVFSDRCGYFSTHDRARLLHYGKIADNNRPRGFGDCGFVVVFQHRTPNDSIPILHADHSQWIALFPRHD